MTTFTDLLDEYLELKESLNNHNASSLDRAKSYYRMGDLCKILNEKIGPIDDTICTE